MVPLLAGVLMTTSGSLRVSGWRKAMISCGWCVPSRLSYLGALEVVLLRAKLYEPSPLIAAVTLKSTVWPWTTGWAWVSSTGPSTAGWLLHLVDASDHVLLLILLMVPPSPPSAVLEVPTVRRSVAWETGKLPTPVTAKRRYACRMVGEPTQSMSGAVPKTVVDRSWSTYVSATGSKVRSPT